MALVVHTALLGGAVVGLARPARFIHDRRVAIALAGVVVGGVAYLIIGLSEPDPYYGDDTSYWKHARNSGTWIYLPPAILAAAASIIGLIRAAAIRDRDRVNRPRVFRLTGIACLLVLFAEFAVGLGH